MDIARTIKDLGTPLGLKVKSEKQDGIVYVKVKLDGKWYYIDPANVLHVPSIIDFKNSNVSYHYGEEPVIATKFEYYYDISEFSMADYFEFGESATKYIEEFPGTVECFRRELAEKVGHDKINHKKYATLFTERLMYTEQDDALCYEIVSQLAFESSWIKEGGRMIAETVKNKNISQEFRDEIKNYFMNIRISKEEYEQIVSSLAHYGYDSQKEVTDAIKIVFSMLNVSME